jgi:hypothetical protein
MGVYRKYRPCDTCGAIGHDEDSDLCPYKYTQARQDPFGLETRQPVRLRPREKNQEVLST